MYESTPQLVFGFHACDSSVGERVLAGKAELLPGKNAYDWLGFGNYFWESNVHRAKQYAKWLSRRTKPPHISNPFVLGAIIDLGHCMNLLDGEYLKLLKSGHARLRQLRESSNRPMPRNRPLRGAADLIFRNLDCAVVEAVHEFAAEAKKPAFDTVRGVFWEGRELYPQAGFRSHNHIQICVRNPNCIKGFFRLRKPSRLYRMPSKILHIL